MAQAKGSQSKLGLYHQSAFGTLGTTGYNLRYTGSSLQLRRNQLRSATITGNRQEVEPQTGNTDVSGAINLELSAGLPTALFFHCLGSITTSGSVTATSTTGASSATTVTFSAPPSGTTATGTISGGVITITNAGSGYQSAPTITLDSGTATVSGMKYAHTIVPGQSLPAGLTIEQDYGDEFAGDVGRYIAYDSCKVASLDISVPTEGFVTMTANVIGRDATQDDAPLDSVIAGVSESSFTAFQTTVKINGTASTVVKSGRITLSNNLDGNSYTLSGDGLRQDIPEGVFSASGNLTALFSNTDLMNYSLDQTETRITFEFQRGNGDGTAGNEFVSIDMRHCKFAPNTPPVQGPGGIEISLDFSTFKDTYNAVSVLIRNRLNNGIVSG